MFNMVQHNVTFEWFLSKTYIGKFIWILVSLYVIHVLSIEFPIYFRFLFFEVSFSFVWVCCSHELFVVVVTNMYSAWVLCLLIANDLVPRS
jgi:hypothetical protein